MSHTLAIHDKRISSGEMKAVDDVSPKMTDWWADFGVGDRGLNRPSTTPEKRVETSGLFFLKELTEDLKRRPKPLDHVEAPVAAAVAMIPPTVLPSEAVLDGRRRSVWIVPGVGVAMVLVALLSALGALWITGRAGGAKSSPLAVAPAVTADSPAARRIVDWTVANSPAESHGALSSTPPMAPPPARPAAGLVVPPPVEKDATTPAAEEPSSKRKRSKKRSRRSRDRDDDEDEDKPAPTTASYSLYATLGAVGTVAPKAAPKGVTPAAQKSGGIATETVTAPRPKARANETFRMLKVAAGGERPKPVARPSLPARIPASAVTRALGQVRSGVQQCMRRFGFGRATIRLRITVSGATGRVTAARALGRFGGAPAGRCAQRRVRSLRFGRFSRSSQTILLPVRTR